MGWFTSRVGAVLACTVGAVLGSSVPVVAAPGPPMAPPANGVLWVDGGTAIDARPEQDGSSRIRIRNDISLGARLAPHLTLHAAGNLRAGWTLGAVGDSSKVYAGQSLDEADLYRLHLRYAGKVVRINAGRFVRISAEGAAKIDGASLDVGRGGPVAVSGWVGRVGHPEPLTPISAVGGGVDVRLRPPRADGTGWSGAAVEAGWEVRRSEAQTIHRVHVEGSLRDGWSSYVLGGMTLGLVQPRAGQTAGAPRLRARVEAALMPSAVVRFGGGVRWEGLERANIPESSQGLLEIIVPEGYAVADAFVRLHPGPVQISVRGGPTLFPVADGPARIGAKGRASADLRRGRGSLGAFAAAASVGPSHYAGGGLSASARLGPLEVEGEGGLFSFAGLNGRTKAIGEGRLRAELALDPPAAPVTRGTVRVLVEASGGADRLLAPWVRAGVGVRGTFGISRLGSATR